MAGALSALCQPDATGERSALFIARILKGEKPADLPAEQPTKHYLAVNLKTATTLGLTLPQSFLIRTDDVVQ